MKLLGKNGSDALICLRKSIPDWDDRIEKEAGKRIEAKETKQGKRIDITCQNLTSDSSQVARAESNGVSDRTQRKLDRLAKDRPDLLQRVKAKELSVQAAAIPDWDDRIERERMKQTVKEAPVLAGHGAIGNGRKDESRLDIIKSTNGGTSAEYLTSRLKRDAPAIAARLQRGEFKSVRAAAIEAGIVIAPSALDSAKRAFLKLSDLDRNEFLSWVYGEWR